MKIYNLFEKLTPSLSNKDLGPPPNKLFSFILHYLDGYKWQLFFLMLVSAAIAILEVSLFSFMGDIVNWLSHKNTNDFFNTELQTLLIISVIILIVIPILSLIHSLISYQALQTNLWMNICWQTHRFLLQQRLSFYHNEFAGRIATKVIQTSQALRDSVLKIVDVFVYVSIYFGSVVFLMGTADKRLIFPILTWLILYIGLQIYFIPKLKKVSSTVAHHRSSITGKIVDSYTNITTVKAFSSSKDELYYSKPSFQKFLNSSYGQNRLLTKLGVCIQLLNYLLVFSVSLICIYLWSKNSISLGAIAIVISISLRLNGMSQWIMYEVSALFQNIGTVLDGIELLNKANKKEQKTTKSDRQLINGEIEFKNIDFQYEKHSDIKIINNLSLKISAGEKVGIVGRSGAGKSTLINLLLKFYDPNAGDIFLDKNNIDTLDINSLRKNIALVTQDTSLLHRSIKDNISYGEKEVSLEQIINAAKKAHAHNFITELKDSYNNIGYDVEVGDRGVKLSGGQRQRIAIARVILKNAPILILDEATSALDSETEHAIQSSLEFLMKNKTVIAIAHRLSTIAAMDKLIVMENGKIIEIGSHSELLRKNGIYSSLWQHQSGGFIGLN